MTTEEQYMYDQEYDEMTSMGSTHEEATSYLDWKFGINQG